MSNQKSEIISISDLSKDTTQNKGIIFGGSFDPIHQGHISLIKSLLEYFKKVLIAPTKQNPWKERESLDLDFRLRLIQTVLKDEQILDKTELIDYPYEYSKDLVAHLKTLKSSYSEEKTYWATGEDSKGSISKWKDFETLGITVVIVPIEINIHSTQIREGMAKAHPAIAERIKDVY